MRAQGSGDSKRLELVLDLFEMRRRIRASLGENDEVEVLKRKDFWSM